YDGLRHPAIHPALTTALSETILPDVGRRLKKSTGYDSFFYGNFSADRKRWEMYPALARYGTQYVGFRQRLAILSESYSYAPFKDRVRASYYFLQGCLEHVAENKDKIRSLLTEARDATARAVGKGKESPLIPVRHKNVALKEPVPILGFAEEQ